MKRTQKPRELVVVSHTKRECLSLSKTSGVSLKIFRLFNSLRCYRIIIIYLFFWISQEVVIAYSHSFDMFLLTILTGKLFNGPGAPTGLRNGVGRIRVVHFDNQWSRLPRWLDG